MTSTVGIRRAGHPDLAHCADVLAAAFHEDPVSCWVVPDPEDRLRRHPRFFEVIVARTLTDGVVHLSTDGCGVALWLDIHPGALASPMMADDAMRDALGSNFVRLSLLERHMRLAHPRDRHAYLAFIGVFPQAQGHGLGRALLDHQLAELDRAGVPAYLEASSPRSLSLYEGVGFEVLPGNIEPLKGPPLYRMWREPQPIRGGDGAVADF